jgi:hypothetical protein
VLHSPAHLSSGAIEPTQGLLARHRCESAMPVIIRDELPRLVTYPIGELFLRSHLGPGLCDDDAGLYFLYLSGVQVNFYDPVLSRAAHYPVLALDRHSPQLCNDAMARLEEEQRKREQIVDDRRAGVLRADAQLRGRDAELAEPERVVGLPELPLSIAIFPVKTRLRRKIEDGIAGSALRPLRNWLAAPGDRHTAQRPLVLCFDEESGKVSAKFADPWDDARGRYYR